MLTALNAQDMHSSASIGLPRGQPDGKEFMVDVVLVRFKRVPAFACTYHDYPDNIEGGNDQGTEGYDKSAFGIRGDIRIDLAVFDGKETQRITQGKAAGVPHENLPGTLGAAEHVVIEERDKDTESGDGKHGIAPQALVDEEKSEDEQGNAAQAGGKPVNAVYQVDGIGDENYGEDGERHADAGANAWMPNRPYRLLSHKPESGKKEAQITCMASFWR